MEKGLSGLGSINRIGELQVIDVEEKQSESQNRFLRDSCIDFEIVRPCTVDHCTDLAVVKVGLGPHCCIP